MSTSADVEAAWNTAIWQHDDILAITDKILPYVILPESETEVGKFYYKKEINFFQALTGRGAKYLQTSTTIGETIEYQFEVEVSYFREADRAGDNFTIARDALETLFALVVSSLGQTWTNTVDIWAPPEGAPQITQVLIDNKSCWKATQSYKATKLTEL